MPKYVPPTDDEVSALVPFLPESLKGFHSDYSMTDYARVLWNLRNSTSPERGVAMSRNSKRWEELSRILIEHGVIEFDTYYTRWSLPEDLEAEMDEAGI